ncbi:MAG: hypothetical protein RIS86_1835, partial [Planctomycetota bacterium]
MRDMTTALVLVLALVLAPQAEPPAPSVPEGGTGTAPAAAPTPDPASAPPAPAGEVPPEADDATGDARDETGDETGDGAADDAQAPPADASKPLDPTILPPEVPTRAFIVVDRFTTSAGVIERDDEREIVLRDDRGRSNAFQKDRVLSIRYLLDGPPGRRVSVRLVDGRTLVGPLVEDSYEGVVLKIADIDTRFPRETLVEVRPYPTDAEFYERFKRTIERDQYEARFSLGL